MSVRTVFLVVQQIDEIIPSYLVAGKVLRDKACAP